MIGAKFKLKEKEISVKMDKSSNVNKFTVSLCIARYSANKRTKYFTLLFLLDIFTR